MKRTKFGNVKTVVDGIKFDSKLEARRYQALKILEKIGEISNLVLQEPFIVIPKQKGERATVYKADFSYQDFEGNKIVEDTKGIKTTEYIMKRKLMLLVHNIRISEVIR